MKGKLFLFVTAIIIIGFTITIYNMIVTEWSSMLYISITVVCCAEFAIISTIGLLPALNYKNGSTGIMVNVYAVLMICWSLIGCNFSGMTYPIGLLIISIIMCILIGLTVMGSHESERINDKVEQTISLKHSFTSSIPNPLTNSPKEIQHNNLAFLWHSIQSSDIDYDTKKRLRILTERIQTLPATNFPNAVITADMNQITAMCRALSETENREDLIERINNKSKELTNYIKSL